VPHRPQAIVYGTIEIDGIPVRQNTRDLLTRAIASGEPIEVHAESAYVNLYHVFDRMQRDDESLRDRTLTRKKVDEARWWIWAIRRDELHRESNG